MTDILGRNIDNLYKFEVGGTWVAQSVKHQTLDFHSGHNLTVCEFKPCIGLHVGSAEHVWDSLSLSLSLSLSAPLLLVLCLSLSFKNK